MSEPFIVNVADAEALSLPGAGSYVRFETDAAPFENFGINVHVLEPGEPNCRYHREDVQESFLVLSGECILILDEVEHRLRAWDFVSCPAGAAHVFVGARRPAVLDPDGRRSHRPGNRDLCAKPACGALRGLCGCGDDRLRGCLRRLARQLHIGSARLATARAVSEAQPPAVVTRRGGVEDIEAILKNVRAGFDTYIEFAPAGWTPPNPRVDRERTLEVLADADTALVIAEVDGEIAGHVGLTPARDRPPGGATQNEWRSRRKVPGMVHLWQLFVTPAWWGTGVADVLHREFIAESGLRGYSHGRLYTPAAHERARRFYERRGWRSLREQLNPELGLALAEYRITLG